MNSELMDVFPAVEDMTSLSFTAHGSLHSYSDAIRN
jgi:hypothetical protein